MAAYIPRNWGWYVAASLIVGPYVLVAIIEPNWVARLIADVLLYFTPPIVLFWYAFGPATHLRDIGVRTAIWPESFIKRVGPRGADYTTKVLILIAGVWWCVYLSMPLINDVRLLLDKRAPLNLSGDIVQIRNTLLIFNNIVIEDAESRSDTLYASYFPFRGLLFGKQYEFVYLPESRLILDAAENSSD